MKPVTSMLAVLLLAASGVAQQPFQIEGPPKATVGEPVELVVKGLPELDPKQTLGELLNSDLNVPIKIDAPDGALVTFDPKLSIDFITKSWRMDLKLRCDKPGVVFVVACQPTLEKPLAVHRVTFSGSEPAPIPDVEPDPPKPQELPFESDGWACLIIEEASERAKLPKEQRSIFTSSDVANFGSRNAVKLSDNQPFFRVWDDDYKDLQLANVPQQLKTAYKKVLDQSNGKLPWIAITNGKDKGYSGPLPATVNDTIRLMQENL